MIDEEEVCIIERGKEEMWEASEMICMDERTSSWGEKRREAEMDEWEQEGATLGQVR